MNHHFVGDIFGGAYARLGHWRDNERLLQLETSSIPTLVNCSPCHSSWKKALLLCGAALLHLLLAWRSCA